METKDPGSSLGTGGMCGRPVDVATEMSWQDLSLRCTVWDQFRLHHVGTLWHSVAMWF